MAGSALMVLDVLTVITSLILRVSPFPDYYWIHKNRTVGEVALLPVVALFVNSAALVMYACVIGDYVPLFLTNSFGVCTATGFVIIFYLHTTDRAYFFKMCGIGLLATAILLAYTLLAAAGLTGESRDDEGTTLGWITVFTTVAQFGSPLATMMKVIRTKSNASLPLMMCIMNVVNCSFWVAYSSVKWNPFILAPSSTGTVLGVIQVTLWIIYRKPQTKPISSRTIETTVPRDSFVIEVSASHRNALERISSRLSTSEPVFVELKSPSALKH